MVVKKEKFNFNKAYQEMQQIVEWFEKDEIDLEEGIKKFEEGSGLVKEMKKYLDTMEHTIKELNKGE